MKYTVTDTLEDGWQLTPESDSLDRATLLQIEMDEIEELDDYGDPDDLAIPRAVTAEKLEPIVISRTLTDMSLTDRQCEECEVQLRQYECLYDLCRDCSRRIGQFRVCDVLRGEE